MGRYISGDFRYKFAVGTQSSNFGEVLEEIINNIKIGSAYLHRYIHTEGNAEYVELDIEHKEEFIKGVKKFIGKEFNVDNEEDTEQWYNKYMMHKFLSDCDDKLNSRETLNFHVEYV